MTYNQLEMALTLTRRDVCDLILALDSTLDRTHGTSDYNKWLELHNNIVGQLDDFDDRNYFKFNDEE